MGYITYHYKGYWGCKACCGLRFYTAPTGETVVVAIELSHNEGTSITNMAEQLATQVCRDFSLDPQRLLWIENYTDLIDGPAERTPDSFDLVSFEWSGEAFSNPKWRPLNYAEVRFLTGGALPAPGNMEPAK